MRKRENRYPTLLAKLNELINLVICIIQYVVYVLTGWLQLIYLCLIAVASLVDSIGTKTFRYIHDSLSSYYNK